MHGLMLLWQFFTLSLRTQLQYRISFFLLTLSQFVSTFVDILAIWVLFDRFKTLQGWSLPELCLIYGIIHMGFAIAESCARGFDHFAQMIRYGDFDRVLLRPISTIFQVAVYEIQFMRIARFFQGLVVLLYGAHALHFSLFSLNALVIMFSIFGTASLFYGLFVIQAAVSFWTVESLEVMNITTFGGLQTGQYPISIYSKPFRLIFTFLIPLACVGYYPIAVLLHKNDTLPLWIGVLTPVFGFAFLLISFQLWHLGVRHYRSTGN